MVSKLTLNIKICATLKRDTENDETFKIRLIINVKTEIIPCLKIETSHIHVLY